MKPSASDIDRLTEVMDSSDPRFSLVCQVLASEKARETLAEVAKGSEAAMSISSALAMSPQSVNYHLQRLEEAGFIRSHGSPTGLRGRRAKRYVVNKVAVVLIPSEVWAEKESLLRTLKKKARETFLTRLGLSGASAIVSGALAHLIVSRVPAPQPGDIVAESLHGSSIVLPWAIGAIVFLMSWYLSRNVR